MTESAALRQQLADLLDWRSAHATFDDAINNIPAGLRGVRPKGLAYSAWELLEHLRRTQHDILDFSRDPEYTERSWPDDYWPATSAPPNADAWDASVAQFRADLRAMQALITDPAIDLFTPIPHGDGQTILREAVLLADHNAYHVGQLIVVQRLLGIWPE